MDNGSFYTLLQILGIFLTGVTVFATYIIRDLKSTVKELKSTVKPLHEIMIRVTLLERDMKSVEKRIDSNENTLDKLKTAHNSSNCTVLKV